MLQYRKRYELLQLKKTMTSQALKKQLQYRKRYELLQLQVGDEIPNWMADGYNTASGMSCCNQ